MTTAQMSRDGAKRSCEERRGAGTPASPAGASKVVGLARLGERQAGALPSRANRWLSCLQRPSATLSARAFPARRPGCPGFQADCEAVQQAVESLLEAAFFDRFAVRRGGVLHDPIEVRKSPAFHN